MGLPKGSLNKKERGNTQQIFLDAGYDILGYEPGKESYKNLCIENDLEIEPKLCRPQDALRNLVRGWLDIAIIGEDWVKEKSTIRNSSAVRKIGDLDYGKTRLVIGIPKESTYTSLSDLFRANQWRDNPIMFATEYPNLTQ